MEKTSQQLATKKDFAVQSLNTDLIDKQIKALKDRDTGKPVNLILQVEFANHAVPPSRFYMIAYLEYTGTDKNIKYEKLDPAAIEATGQSVPLPTPIGLGNIRISFETLKDWIAKTDVKLTPVMYENPHLAYTDGTTSYFPSPPAPSTSTSSGA